MGLDTADIVNTIEKRLGVTLPVKELEKVLTVGDLHYVVFKNISINEGSKCKSQMVFYKLRKNLNTNTGLSKQHVTPNQSLNDIFPKNKRRLAYAVLQRDVQLQLPSLALTPRWHSFLFNFGLTTIVGGLIAALVLINFFSYSKWNLLIPCGGIAVCHILSHILNIKRTLIEQPTIRDFVNKTVALNFATLAVQTGTNKREIEQLVNQTISDISGVELHEITPDKKIGDDLGID